MSYIEGKDMNVSPDVEELFPEEICLSHYVEAWKFIIASKQERGQRQWWWAVERIFLSGSCEFEITKITDVYNHDRKERKEYVPPALFSIWKGLHKLFYDIHSLLVCFLVVCFFLVVACWIIAKQQNAQGFSTFAFCTLPSVP